MCGERPGTTTLAAVYAPGAMPLAGYVRSAKHPDQLGG